MACLRKDSEVSGKRLGRKAGSFLAIVTPLLFLVGCGDNMHMPTVEQMAAFEAADPIVPPVNMERINKAKLQTGPYRVVPGDVLEFAMPALLRAVTEAEIQAAKVQNGKDHPFICRVSNEGTVALPAVGDLDVAGKSLAEIEVAVVKAYERYAVNRPSIYVRIIEYTTAKVYIAGVVEKPGVYTLRADQMTLVSLLTEAGGISAAGAALVRVIGSEVREVQEAQEDPPVEVVPPIQDDAFSGTIAAPSSRVTTPTRLVTIRSSARGPSIHIAALPRSRSREVTRLAASMNEASIPAAVELAAAGASPAQDPPLVEPSPGVSPEISVPNGTPGSGKRGDNGTIVLPVVGMNIPFRDVALTEGDTVVVEPIQMPLISVLGLVRNPGNFEYPPHARYNLAQVIALAGGLDMNVNPRYASVYRLKRDGTILRIAFKLIEEERYTERLNVSVRPGDLVVVEHTPRTRTNAFVNRVVRLSVGTWVDVSDLWDDN